ncbi:hypothetical protein ACQR1I_36370 [Bradyrhizobium sp. HKCCYLS2038]|uniref:hypothetical protein n=1 Tax=Bradyrhizobium sp. HKCCYLS2038 TaxID=3420764 RepID=UPI003EC0B2A2
MTANIYDFPVEWYSLLTTQKMPLRSLNQAAATTWNGAGQGIIGPHTQLWTTDISFRPMYDPLQQDVDAWVSRLRGRANVARIGHALRQRPWYDRASKATSATFSDGTRFTDGSGFDSGLLPPEVYIAVAAAKGTRYLTLGGFPVSTANVMRAGDLLQIKPNGVPGAIPHLYKVMYGGSSNASGMIGLEIEPMLRTSIAVGDTVGLRNPTTLFRLVDDTQGDVETSGGGIGSLGLSFVEALDLVP